MCDGLRSRLRCLHCNSGRLTRADLWCVCDLCEGRIHVDEMLYHFATLQEVAAKVGVIVADNPVAGTAAVGNPTQEAK